MSEQTKDLQPSGSVNELLRISLSSAEQNFPQMEDKAKRASVALSAIVKIETDEQDAEAEKLMVKVRNTYDLIVGMRKEITAPLDNIKVMAMKPEKMISSAAADSDISQYLRVKSLRDGFANEKIRKQKEAEQKALKERNEKEESARVAAALKERVFNSVVSALILFEEGVKSFFSAFTLATYRAQLSDLVKDDPETWEAIAQWFDSRALKMSAKPNLKREVYDSWFVVAYDSAKLPEDSYNKLVAEAKENNDYEPTNAEYIRQAEDIKRVWMEKIPTYRSDLQQIFELEKTNKEAADEMARKQKEDADKAFQESVDKAEVKMQENAEEVQQEQQQNVMSATFEQQVATQAAAANLSGVRMTNKVIITAPQEQIVEIFARVLFACFSNAKFPGYLKRDKKGNLLEPDVNGIPIYADWADTILEFYANYCKHNPAEVPGIEIKEVASTSARDKKAKPAPETL